MICDTWYITAFVQCHKKYIWDAKGREGKTRSMDMYDIFIYVLKLYW